MSFVTTACGGAAAGSPTPAEPCPHNGAATSEATATVAHQRAQCVIPTSVEDCGGVLPPPPPETHKQLAARSGVGRTPPPGGGKHPCGGGPGGHNVQTPQPARPPPAEPP